MYACAVVFACLVTVTVSNQSIDSAEEKTLVENAKHLVHTQGLLRNVSQKLEDKTLGVMAPTGLRMHREVEMFQVRVRHARPSLRRRSH